MKKVIIITGASRGIGKATAIKAAKAGYAVCINYLSNKAAANEVLNAICRENGRGITVQADIAIESDVKRLFETADEQLGSVTALVNNASILETQTQVKDISFERLKRVFNCNIIGSFLCAKEAINRMSTQLGGSGGAIVNVSSGASCSGSPNEYIDYAASKGAIDTFTIGLAKEVADQGIRVNAVRPGFIYTDIHADGGEADRVDRIKPSIPMQRGGQPEEVANGIMWLLSDEASYTTGALLDIAGGK